MTDIYGYIEGLAFCSIRPGVALALIPLTDIELLGVALRLPLTLMFAALAQQTGWPQHAAEAIVIEILIGITLGLLLSVTFRVAATAGALLDQQGGYTIGATHDPAFRDESSLFEKLFVWFAVLTFFTGAGLRSVHGFFADAWVLWPPGALRPDYLRVMQELAELGLARSIVDGIKLAMPLAGLLMMVDIAVGLTSRYARRINPFSTAPAIKAAVLSFAMLFCLPVVLARLNAVFIQGALMR